MQRFHNLAEFFQKPVISRVDVGKRYDTVEMGVWDEPAVTVFGNVMMREIRSRSTP